jgi:hypothetical protein
VPYVAEWCRVLQRSAGEIIIMIISHCNIVLAFVCCSVVPRGAVCCLQPLHHVPCAVAVCVCESVNERERPSEREGGRERERNESEIACACCSVLQSCGAVRTPRLPSDRRLTADVRANLRMAYRCRRQAFKMRKRRFECGHARS